MDTVRLTPDQERARRARNLIIAVALAAFFVLVFVISIAQMRAGVVAGAAGGAG